MSSFPAIHEPLDRPFIRQSLRQFPGRMAGSIARQYSKRPTRRERNLYLLDLAEQAQGQKFRMAGDEDAIRTWAVLRAGRWAKLAARAAHQPGVCAALTASARREGFEVPEVDKNGVTEAGILARFGDHRWWRRQARKRYGRGAEAIAIRAGLVAKWAERYVSDEAVQRRHTQKRRNRRMLEECQAVNELGEKFTLAELSDLSVSNPIIRRSELMVRIAGCDAIAAERGDVGEFITWTCPSRFHAHSKKFDGSTPRQAAAHLQTMWEQCRAKLARMELPIYGIRVAEPHKDGCPHWHLLLFMRPGDRAAILAVMRHYALKVDGSEAGAAENRFKAVAIDPAKGSAAGYVAKYVSKNIDGFGLEADLLDGDPVANANRVDAWASTWGIRQFQFIGGPSVGVWRELRRLDSEETGPIEAARAAADSADWAAYMRIQGGPFCGRQQRVKLAKWEEFDQLTGALTKTPHNRYGEARGADVFGVTDGCLVVVSRVHQWEIQQHGKADESGQILSGAKAAGDSRLCAGMVTGQSSAEGLERGKVGLGAYRNAAGSVLGGFGSSWSPVNNCTGEDSKIPPRREIGGTVVKFRPYWIDQSGAFCAMRGWDGFKTTGFMDASEDRKGEGRATAAKGGDG